MLGVQIYSVSREEMYWKQNAGGFGDGAQPLPISNREVKLVSGENNYLATNCENSSPPAFCFGYKIKISLYSSF